MRIAIVGYGSLIWDLENLAPFVTGGWDIGGGPAMPVEFSRISPKRQQALVLVIDETLDHACKTCVIESTRQDVASAVTDLARRERCAEHMIGHALAGHDGPYAPWLASNGYDAMIWTALPGNFSDITGKPFCHENARDYLKTLKGPALQEAWRYISFAPEVTDTPLRRYLAEDAFWSGLGECVDATSQS